MLQLGTQGRNGGRLGALIRLRFWLVLLLAGVFAASTFLHVAGGSHAAAAAAHPHELAAAMEDVGDAPCSADEHQQVHRVACEMTGSCTLCVPMADQVDEVGPDAAAMEPTGVLARTGNTRAPDRHPPRSLGTI